ncbi:response regulator transcription factor [Zunongwangia sp. SCSIO 43204]|uniref:response regulator n=1 Tax=unclassified Zunongwangia TaxID=2632541 RepID=UPI001CA94EF3|nr:response regulator [Zunongwangia sp. SCSIO 43204]UAB84363.1 response regulator transcription factor [Zunongwangia sp. SCSIO 43204]
MQEKKVINILLVDDHHMILEGYKNVLSKIKSSDFTLNVETSDNCDKAWEIVNEKRVDIIFLDINFPISDNNKILSGEDLGIKIKKQLPEIKIIILTVLGDPFRLHNILLNTNPDGFLLKGETTSEELNRCLSKVIANPPYYGSKISKMLHSEVKHNNSLIDEVDRIMLYQLSLGTKTKDLTKFVHLSLRAVEDRKRKLKEIFGVSGEGNKALLEKARESGYI